MKYVFVFLINFYQIFLRPFYPRSCRFYPSCSVYAKESFYVYGCLKGFYLCVQRIVKCNPFHPGGFDPLK